MGILLLGLILATLLFVYMKKGILSKITACLAVLGYVVYLCKDLAPWFLLLKSGVAGFQTALWQGIILLLLVGALVTVLKGARKWSLWLLWITAAVLLLTNWHSWLMPILTMF